MTPVLASSGIDLTIADVVAGSALFVGLLGGVSGVWFRYEALSIAGGLVSFGVGLYLLITLRREDSLFAMIVAVLVLVAGLALVVVKRGPKKKPGNSN